MSIQDNLQHKIGIKFVGKMYKKQNTIQGHLIDVI